MFFLITEQSRVKFLSRFLMPRKIAEVMPPYFLTHFITDE